VVVLTSFLLVVDAGSDGVDTTVDPLLALDPNSSTRERDSVGIAAVSPTRGLRIRDVLRTVAVAFLGHEESGFTGGW
jgi:hypothetical protein